jgi:hypothetical protein
MPAHTIISIFYDIRSVLGKVNKKNPALNHHLLQSQDH